MNGDRELLATTPYPEDLQWESLVDVLRGRVKVVKKVTVKPCQE